MHLILFLLTALAQSDTADPYPGRYSEGFDQSLGIRQEQFDQITAYTERLLDHSEKRRAAFFEPDYSSVAAYRDSCAVLRESIQTRIGYPPPDTRSASLPRWERVAEDEYATVYRMWVEVLKGVEAYGLLAVPHGLDGPAPLLICQHGGGGSPELIAPFSRPEDGHGSFNYGWMVQRALKAGYVTWSPSLLFPLLHGNEQLAGPNRLALDKRARHVGTSLLAIELWKIQRGLDTVLKRREVDSERVGMIGLSYGGLYTQFAAALDPRIQVAVSSCFFNARRDYAWDDWSYFNFLNEFTDPEICALIAPRGLLIEVGKSDKLFAVEKARALVAQTREPWEHLGAADRFEYVEFEGGHEFHGDRAFAFVNGLLKPNNGKKQEE